MTAFVLGNGESRLAIDLELLRGRGRIYGCNALYRDFRPDVLVATDRGIAEEIQETGYARHWEFYTRRPLPHSGAQTIPKPYYGYSSGPVALSLAADAKFDPIYIIGFDMGPNAHGTFNNVYAGTSNYKARGTDPTFTGNWARQMVRIIREHHRQQFIRVMGKTTAHLSDFDNMNNFKTVTMQEFLDWLNNKKDS